ncbi:MAG: helix-turn-helix domain-containing protein [Betaproteobacteria bacterium]|jgi:hypothetical protein
MESKSGCYKTMDLAVREEISLGLAKGLDQAQIARLVGFAPRHPPQRPITPSAVPQWHPAAPTTALALSGHGPGASAVASNVRCGQARCCQI